jgi:LPXTG-motif cell wall-anchored protein
MDTAAQIGLGIGITFGIILLAGVAGLYLWRRRRNLHDNSMSYVGSDKVKHRTKLPKIHAIKRRGDAQDDAEWSIESAEKVSIVKNMRAQSVNTVSRSNSHTSEKSNDGCVAPIAMRGGNLTAALTSHPMTPSYTGFRTGDGEAKVQLPKLDLEKRELKLLGWPMER